MFHYLVLLFVCFCFWVVCRIYQLCCVARSVGVHYAEWFDFTFYLQTNTFSSFLHLTRYFIILDIGLCMRVWCEQHRRRKPRVWLFKPNFLPYMENIEQDSIVREVDNIIQWISLYLVNSELRFVITYPLDGGLFVKMELSALYYDFNRTIL